MSRILIALLFISLGSTGFCQKVDSNLVKSHLHHIVDDFPNRNFQNISALDSCAAYIKKVFSEYGDSTVYQSFGDSAQYKNVITSFGPKDGKRIIVGAHYDVCGNQDGADDNASGVVVLLELARLFAKEPPKVRVDLVAYTLEEPPFFRSNYMGSYIHAKYLQDEKIDIHGMVCLEMIGYFSDERKSQSYPLGILKLFYGGKGDYITYVKRTKGGKMPKQYKHFFKKNKMLKTKVFTGPAKLQGIDFSDHLNYWKLGYDAIMITNTGFFRNPNYHEKTDQIKTLNIAKMSAVIQQIYASLLEYSTSVK